VSTGASFAGTLWLAPLTRGGHLAFRRLCVEFGARVTVGEMALARKLIRDDSREFALLKSHPDELLFGAQLAGNKPDELAEAAHIAEARGARFVDLNCGCPIHAITGRGLGASLLQKPARIGRLVEAMRRAVSIPVTVKLRSGYREDRPNLAEVARVCEQSGAAALAIHGRSREQRYNRSADWDLIGRVAAERRIPVVGNGDILTHYEAAERARRSGVASLMLARGALIKPWLFRELREGHSWLPSAAERLGVVWRLLELMRDHFGADERGRRRIMGFLPWHLDFLSRYRPLPEGEFGAASQRHPLIQTRWPIGAHLPPLERLLRDPRPETHARLARELTESTSRDEALDRALGLAASLTPPPAELASADADADEALVAG